MIVSALCVVGAGVIVALTRYQVIADEKALAAKAIQVAGDEIAQWIDSYGMFVSTLAAAPAVRGGNREEAKAFIQSIGASMNPDIQSLIFIDKNGNGAYHTGREGDLSDRDYFKTVVVERKTKTLVTNPFLARSTGDVIVAFVSAVTDKNGEVSGAIFASVASKALNNAVEKLKISESSEGWLIDSSGLIFAHPNPETILKMTIANSKEFGYEGLDKNAKYILSNELRGGGGGGAIVFSHPHRGGRAVLLAPRQNTPKRF
ncbi:MAG: cache domain-containing protein, partial [Helicobacteraceae bacterium]|nr:cache domain-containing protein [Helicobacteraceae bacterium]